LPLVVGPKKCSAPTSIFVTTSLLGQNFQWFQQDYVLTMLNLCGAVFFTFLDREEMGEDDNFFSYLIF